MLLPGVGTGLPAGPLGGGWGDCTSCQAPLLCCAAQAVFCPHGLGSLSLCLFSSLSPLYRILHAPPLPLFYILSFTPVLLEPRECVHSVPLGVRVHLACPPPRRVCSQARPPSTFIHLERLCLPLLAQPRRLDNFVQNSFHYGLKLGGLGPT